MLPRASLGPILAGWLLALGREVGSWRRRAKDPTPCVGSEESGGDWGGEGAVEHGNRFPLGKLQAKVRRDNVHRRSIE